MLWLSEGVRSTDIKNVDRDMEFFLQKGFNSSTFGNLLNSFSDDELAKLELIICEELDVNTRIKDCHTGLQQSIWRKLDNVLGTDFLKNRAGNIFNDLRQEILSEQNKRGNTGAFVRISCNPANNQKVTL